MARYVVEDVKALVESGTEMNEEMIELVNDIISHLHLSPTDTLYQLIDELCASHCAKDGAGRKRDYKAFFEDF